MRGRMVTLMLNDSTLSFRKDGTFRVLQLADIQDGPVVDPDAVALIDAAVREADPDLVVLTGDQIRGYDPGYMETFTSRRGDAIGAHVSRAVRLEAMIDGYSTRCSESPMATGGSESALRSTRLKIRESIRQFLDPIVSRGIPFAVTYGNHDFQCGVMPDEQDEIYRQFPGCLNPRMDDVRGTERSALACEVGSFAMPIMSRDGSRVAMGIMMVNSGDFDESGGYGAPSDVAVKWLERVRLGADGGNPVPSVVFQHIPPQDFYRCLRKTGPLTPNAVRGHRMFSDSCYVLNPEVCRPGSTLGEGPCCSERAVGEVEAMRRAGGYFALYCGHDHKNTFVATIDGMDYGYAPTCGFRSYGPHASDRALRLFVFHEDDPRSYETRLLRYGDLIGRASCDPLRILAGEYMVSSLSSLGDVLRRPRVAGCLLVLSCLLVTAIGRIGTLWRRRIDRS